MNLDSFLFIVIILTTSESVYLATYSTALIRVSLFELRALYKYWVLDSKPQLANLEEETKELYQPTLILLVDIPRN